MTYTRTQIRKGNLISVELHLQCSIYSSNAQLCSQVCVTVSQFIVVFTLIWSVLFHFHWCCRLFVLSCWRQTTRPAQERSVSLSRCSRAPTSNSTGLLRGLLPCQDISHLHSESTLADLPSQAAIIKITCEKSWGTGSKAYGILAPHFLNWD